MIGLLTEQYAGAFPLWLSPVQVRVLAVADRHVGYAQEIAKALQGFPSHNFKWEEEQNWVNLPEVENLQLRVEVDASRETIGKKIRDGARMKIPYLLIVGDRDIEAGTVGIRSREAGDLGAMDFKEFVAKVKSEL
jgi:threonyl-tRNA synthetase